MKLSESWYQTIPVLALNGRFDAHQVNPIAAKLDTYSQQPPALILVDLSEVTFIDSQALATLVQALKRCRQQGGDLVICGLAQPVRIIFELTRLDRAFAIYADVETAVTSLNSTENTG